MNETIAIMLAVTPETVTSSSVEITSVWDFIVKGGPMMIPIGLASLLGLAVLAERLVSLRRERVVPMSFITKFNAQMNEDGADHAGTLKLCRAESAPVARILEAGVRHLGGPIEHVEKSLKETGERQVLGLRKYLRLLSVLAAVTPLMGLLGTIFGMIRAFQTVAASAEALGKTELLAAGIYEAMITTAAGLCVAIPTLIVYHWIASRVDGLTLELDHAAVEFVDTWATPAAPGAQRMNVAGETAGVSLSA